MKKDTQKGFTLFIAVVISSLLLLVVLSISNIALQETILSGAGRESQLAFYAADSGVECALFWDYRNPGHDHSAFLSPQQSITCGQAVTYEVPNNLGVGIPQSQLDPGGIFEDFDPGKPTSPNKPSQGVPATSQFKVSFANGTCAIVGVTKYYVPGVLRPKSTISSRGQSDCINLNNPRRYERAIRVIDSR